MSDDDDVFGYKSGDDDEGANDDDNQIAVPKKFRGPVRIWEVIDQHPTFEAAKVSIQKHNEPVLRRLKGTLNRGKTLSLYYYCVKKLCGCTKQWGLVTSLDSHLVTEEESTGDNEMAVEASHSTKSKLPMMLLLWESKNPCNL